MGQHDPEACTVDMVAFGDDERKIEVQHVSEVHKIEVGRVSGER